MVDDVTVISAWHEALNSGDADRLAALVHDDVEVGGPRGVGHGAALVREWVERAGIRLEASRFFGSGDTIVVEQEAAWQLPESGEYGEPQEAATIFRMHDGRIHSIHRHATLADALTAAGLTETDEVSSATNAARS